ncbi:MAG: T9SS type A sorting domain-containing protein, partial [Bacteroidia bacterium]|nr:T9SS type A sorting domain-containing protein [Bacteroidia bacterium]
VPITYTVVVTGPDGCERFGTARVEPCVSRSSSNDGPTLSVFPNPNSGTFVVERRSRKPAEGPLRIYDERGMLIFETRAKFPPGKGEWAVHLSLPAGVYRMVFDATGLTFVVR